MLIKVLMVSEYAITRIGMSFSIFWEKCGYTVLTKVGSLNQAKDIVTSEGVDLMFVELPMEDINYGNCILRFSSFDCKVIILGNDKNIDLKKYKNNQIIDGIYIQDYEPNDMMRRLKIYNHTIFQKSQPTSDDAFEDDEIIKVARYQFMESLIYGRNKRGNISVRKLKSAGLVFPYDNFIVIMIKFNIANKNLDLLALADYFWMKFLRTCIYMCPNEFDELVFICNFYDLAGENFAENLDSIKSKINRILKEVCDTSFSIHGCDSYHEYENISTAYLECCDNYKMLAQSYTQDMEQNVYIKNIMNFIDENYATEIHLKDLAEQVGFTPSYFSAFFKAQTGVNYSDFIVDYRLKKACHLLSTTTLTINEISRQVGYNKGNYFSKLFKSKTGISPTVYRKFPNQRT